MDNQRLKILIIDDSEVNLMIFIRAINEYFQNADVFTTKNGPEGISVARKEQPDMIFLDIIMPGMDGFEVCRELKSDEKVWDIPVVFVTAGPSDRENRLLALECGSEGFMSRPYDEMELVTQVRAMAKIRRANLLKRDEKVRLSKMVEKQTIALRKANRKTVKLLRNLKHENEARKKSEVALKQAQRIAKMGSCEHELYSGRMIYSEEAMNVLAVKEERVATLEKLAEYLGKNIKDKDFRRLLLEHQPIRFLTSFGNSEGALKKRYVEIQLRPRFGPGGKHIGNIGTIQDITEMKIKENEILYLSYHDYLTGLYNRRYFDEKLLELDLSENLPISLVMADVNGLKLINDSFGHDYGDGLLKSAARIMQEVIRESDVVARLGGDEFMMLLPKTKKEEALDLTRKIEKRIAGELIGGMHLSIAFGIATKTRSIEKIDEIQKKAEDVMYRQKLCDNSSVRSKTVELIINTLYEKSNREMFHSKRVGDICRAIAKEMRIDRDIVKQVGIAGLLHDIGKMGVDENILNKPAGLDWREWEQMKRHPEVGYRILTSTGEFTEIARYVFEHHERWDGSGYPKGLKGVEISLQARIIGVADSFDAMTTDRAYRKGLSEEDAILEIKRNAGKQFDPIVAQVFVENVLGKPWGIKKTFNFH